MDLIAFYRPLVSPSDQGALAPLQEAFISFLNCRNHFQTETILGEIGAKYFIEMGLVLSGSAEQLRSSPPISAFICTIAPLGHDTH
jgi:hypothetical protein